MKIKYKFLNLDYFHVLRSLGLQGCDEGCVPIVSFNMEWHNTLPDTTPPPHPQSMHMKEI